MYRSAVSLRLRPCSSAHGPEAVKAAPLGALVKALTAESHALSKSKKAKGRPITPTFFWLSVRSSLEFYN